MDGKKAAHEYETRKCRKSRRHLHIVSQGSGSFLSACWHAGSFFCPARHPKRDEQNVCDESENPGEEEKEIRMLETAEGLWRGALHPCAVIDDCRHSSCAEPGWFVFVHPSLARLISGENKKFNKTKGKQLKRAEATKTGAGCELSQVSLNLWGFALSEFAVEVWGRVSSSSSIEGFLTFQSFGRFQLGSISTFNTLES